jgi:protein SCO1
MNRTFKIIYCLGFTACFIAGLMVFRLGLWPAESTPSTPTIGGNFTLQSTAGPVALKDFKGRIVIIYFGYMSCPDVCPTALASMSAAIKQLNETAQAQIQPLFISVDPERDRLENLAVFSSYFYPTMLGLTGNITYLKQLTKQYGTFFQYTPLPDSKLGYTVDHTSRIFLIDTAGKLAQTVSHRATSAEILTALQKLLSSS